MNNKNYRKHPLIPREYIDIGMSDEEKEEQRRSFAFGNLVLHNSEITRKDIDRATERIDKNRTMKYNPQ